MAQKLAVNEQWKGRSISFTFRRGVITLNDRTTQKELEYLFSMNHPAVYVVKEEPKPKKEVSNES